MSRLVKVCGVRSAEDARCVVDAGATALGLNFWPGSPRCITPEQGARIADAVRGEIALVSVTVNADAADLQAIQTHVKPDHWQLHGDETGDAVTALGATAFKAVGLAGPEDVDVALAMPGPWVLVDARDAVARGGTGRAPPDDLVARVVSRRATLLAGGLKPENVGDAIRRFRPAGVDTASGVESAPGVKDPQRVRAFVSAALAAW